MSDNSSYGSRSKSDFSNFASSLNYLKGEIEKNLNVSARDDIHLGYEASSMLPPSDLGTGATRDHSKHYDGASAPAHISDRDTSQIGAQSSFSIPNDRLPSAGYTDRSIRREKGIPGDRYLLTDDADYKMETMHILMESFKTKMRADFDSTFVSVDKKTRLLRKELIEHLNESLDDVEDRVTRQMKSLFHESQLAEIDFRKGMKSEIFVAKSDIDSLGRMSNDRFEELERKLRLTESFYREVKAELEEVASNATKKGLNAALDDGD